MKIAIVTVGCKLNQFESDALAQRLRESGFEIVEDMADADTVVINTCTVTNTADSKSRQYMKQAKRLEKCVIVTGCYATTDGEEIKRRGLADMVVSNENKFTLPSLLLENSLREREDFPLVVEYERTRAYLKIQDGCNRFCSYCKIPYGRGRSRSLSFLEVISRFEELVKRGYKEIVLTGVNISDYRDGERGLAKLVKNLLDIPGEYRLRLSSLQPDQFEMELLDVLFHPRMTPHFHLSLQSGSDTVLSRMRRHYTAREFLALCQRIRSVREDTSLTTDIIVGFPGET
ncbi:MAG: MiaB/RimO family radical SAM methylthiotransferase, partial [Brevinematales bacterium]